MVHTSHTGHMNFYEKSWISMNINLKVHEYLWIWIWLSMKLLWIENWTSWICYEWGKMIWAVWAWMSPKTENSHSAHMNCMNWFSKLALREFVVKEGEEKESQVFTPKKARITQIYERFCETSVFSTLLALYVAGGVQV